MPGGVEIFAIGRTIDFASTNESMVTMELQPLDILTVTVMPMVLGLAVDDTIHLTNHIKREFIKTSSCKKATLPLAFSALTGCREAGFSRLSMGETWF